MLNLTRPTRGGPHVRSWSALFFGAIFGCVTGYVIFVDVLQHGKPFTTDHLMSLTVLVGTMVAGHWFSPTVAERRFFAAIGLGVLFVVGTYYCVTASASRSAVVTLEKAGDIHKVNEDRERVEEDLRNAKQRLNAALDEETRECVSAKKGGNPDGGKCKGWRTTRKERENNVAILTVRLEGMAAPKVEDAELKYTAKVLALFLTAKEEAIVDALKLTFPYIKAGFCELATLIFIGLAFGHRPATVAPPTTVAPPGIATVAPVVGGPRATVAPVKPRRTRPATVAHTRNRSDATVVAFPGATVPPSKDRCLQLLLDMIARGGTVPSQDALAELFQVNKSTVSRWLIVWEAAGHITRAQSGRRKEITR